MTANLTTRTTPTDLATDLSESDDHPVSHVVIADADTRTGLDNDLFMVHFDHAADEDGVDRTIGRVTRHGYDDLSETRSSITGDVVMATFRIQ